MKKKLIVMSLYISSFIVASDATVASLDKHKFWGLGSLFNISPTETAKNLIKSTFPVEEVSGEVIVQTDSSLSLEEKNFVQRRTNHIQQVLQNSFGIDKPLRLGFCCSGGGNRAMVGTLGFLTGAAKSHVLDASMYVSGLSGSTWLISQMSYLAATSYKYQSLEKILHDIKNDYKKRLSNYSMINAHGMYAPPFLSFESTDDIFVDIAKRFAYDQDLTLINLYGALIGDYALGLMGRDRLSEKWTSISAEAEHGTMPLPLCAATYEMTNAISDHPYGWFEMSPLQCGSNELGYIPVKYLGSNFYNGKLNTEKLCHEYPISYFLGMYGSAFAVTIKEFAEFLQDSKKRVTILSDAALAQFAKRGLFDSTFITGFVHSMIENLLTSRNPLVHSHFSNYSRGISTSLLQHEESLGLFDAGIDINLPMPILLQRPERSLDIVFMYDSNNGSVKILQEIKEFCRKKSLPFPELPQLTNAKIESCDVIIINDPRYSNYDKNNATYFYFPTNNVDIKSYPYNTFNFKYDPEHVEYLSSKMEQSFLRALNDIKEVMNLVAQARYV